MKLTTGILAVAMITGAAWAQNPSANNQTNAPATPAQRTQPAKPAPGAPAPAVKPVVIPGGQPAATAKLTVVKAASPVKVAAKAPSTPAAKNDNNRLESVRVVRNADDVQIKISPREAVTAKVSKLSSPARVVVELPATVMATAQNKIPVGSAGVKGVRIGMDGKTPPTTSVVVDLEQAIGYELMPGAGNEIVLTLHTTQTAAKNAPANTSTPASKPQPANSKPVAVAKSNAAKTSTPAPKAQVVAIRPVAAAPSAASKVMLAVPPANNLKVAVVVPPAKTSKTPSAAAAVSTAKPAAAVKMAVTTPVTIAAAAPTGAVKVAPAATAKTTQPNPVGVIAKVEAPKPQQKKWAMSGKRDPFFSPVVQQGTGSGCSTGKKCLEIGQINVRGVVKSDSGFIAVVTNSLNKAYFLHENDPVFNGYVVRITGDSVVFQETMQDKLGKPFTREVTKRITTPAV